MNRIMLLIGTVLLFLPILVLGKEELTITYDSNDGTNRTKVKTIEKGDSYRLEGQELFGFSKGKTPLQDRVIDSWYTNPNGTGYYYPIDEDFDSSLYSYSYLNDSSNITLYAIWDDRKDVTRGLSEISLTGDGAITDDEGNHKIDTDKSYNIKFSFQETSRFQFGQLSYYKLPSYFLDVLNNDEEARENFSKKRTITLRISYSGQTYNAKGTYYIEGDYLILNLLRDGTYENHLMFSATNLSIRIWYYCNVSKEYYNNRLLTVKEYEFNTSDSTMNNVRIYPKGKILARFVSDDGSKQLADDILTKEILGTKYTKSNLKIDGYELVEVSNNGDYVYEEGTQTVFYKYKKVNNIKNSSINILKNPKTSSLLAFEIILLLLAISSIIYIVNYSKKLECKEE